MAEIRERLASRRAYADGGQVSPYSIRGLANKISSGADAVSKTFSKPEGYTPAVAAPAAAPAPAPAGGIAGYVSNSTLAAREKAAGLKDGGPVKGPGTGTSDDVPIMASNGEYVLPTDTTAALGGPAALDKVVAATHTPVRKGKGPIAMKANGGTVEDERLRAAAMIPGNTSTVVSGEPVTSTEIGRNVSNTLSAVPGASPVLGAIRALSGASSALPAASGLLTGMARTVAPVAPYAPVVGGIAALNATANPPAAPATSPVPTPAAVPAASAPAATTITAPGAGAIQRINTPGTSPVFTNVTDPADAAAFAARGPISARNMGAANALDASSRAETAGLAAKSQFDQQVADARATNLAGGFGTGGPVSARDKLMATLTSGRKLTARGAQLLAGIDQQDATNKVNQMRLAIEQTTAGVENAIKTGQVQIIAQRAAARAKLLSAKTPEAKAAAEDELRAIDGKYEKAQAPVRALVVPGGTDEMGVKAPSAVYDPDTKTFITAAGGAKQALPPKDQLKAGTVYDTPRGKAKWDGKQFIPA